MMTKDKETAIKLQQYLVSPRNRMNFNPFENGNKKVRLPAASKTGESWKLREEEEEERKKKAATVSLS